MSIQLATERAQQLATERLQPHHIVRQGDAYAVGAGYNPEAVENVFPSDGAYGGNGCRNGMCG